MKKIILIDLDNTLIDFNECARHSIINAFSELGFTYTDKVFETFITENVKIWKRLEKGRGPVDKGKKSVYITVVICQIRFNSIIQLSLIQSDGDT